MYIHKHLSKYIHIYIYIYIYIKPDIGIMVRVFGNGLEDLGFNPRSSHTKDFENGT